MSVLFTRRGEATLPWKRLSDYVEGDIVLIHESGTPVEFYVAKHDYESALNGSGRTLLVRKDCSVNRAWNSSSKNTYADSTVNTWLNNDYKALLSDEVQTAIGETTFYYTVGSGNANIAQLSEPIFLLSANELGMSVAGSNAEGSTLAIASTLLIAKMNGSAVAQWTRTAMTNSSTAAVIINKTGVAASSRITGVSSSGGSLCYRPCFTLPAETKFYTETNVIK